MSWASGNGVSPSLARPGEAWHGRAGLGGARRGVAWVAIAARRAYGLSLPLSLAVLARRGMARSGVAMLSEARCGLAEFGKGCRQQHWGLRLPLLLSTEGRSAAARLGWARHGEAWRGSARHGAPRQGLQTAARSFFGGSRLFSLKGRRGRARHGTPRFGMARRGTARHGLTISARGASAPLAGFFGIQTRPGMAKRGRVRPGMAGRGLATHGKG